MKNLLKIGPLLVCLTMLLACSSTQPLPPAKEVVIQTEYKYIMPPANMLEVCQANKAEISDNASLLDYARYLESVIDKCSENDNQRNNWIKHNG